MSREEMENKIEAMAMCEAMRNMSDSDLSKLETALISRFIDKGVETFDIESFHALNLEKMRRHLFA